MQVVQTAGPPPNHGRTYLPISGWTWNRRNAPANTVAANSQAGPPRRAAAGAGGPGGRSGSLRP
jgi:hypothetical protein